MHSPGPGPSNRQRSCGLPCVRWTAGRVLLAAVVLPLVGLRAAGRQWGRVKKRGRVRRRRNAAEVVAEQLISAVHR